MQRLERSKSVESVLEKEFSNYSPNLERLHPNSLFFKEYAGVIEAHYRAGSHIPDGIMYDGYFLHDNGTVVKVIHNREADKPDKANIIKHLPLIQTLAAGTNFGLFLDHDGKVWLYDENLLHISSNCHYMQGRVDELKPQMLDIREPVQAITACDRHCLLLTVSGKVFALGKNDYGQLGFPERKNIYKPTEIPGLKDIQSIATDTNGSYFEDGSSRYHRGDTLPSTRKKYFWDVDSNIWTISGFSHQGPTSKHISIHKRSGGYSDFIYEGVLVRTQPEQCQSYLAIMESFRAEINKFEKLFLSMYLKKRGLNLVVLNLITRWFSSRYEGFVLHAIDVFADILRFPSEKMQRLIDIAKQAQSNDDIAAMLKLLQIYHYLIQHHEKDGVVSHDQTVRVKDFAELLVLLSHDDNLKTMQELESHLTATNIRYGFQARTVGLGFFSFNIPHYSQVYYATRQQLVSSEQAQSFIFNLKSMALIMKRATRIVAADFKSELFHQLNDAINQSQVERPLLKC